MDISLFKSVDDHRQPTSLADSLRALKQSRLGWVPRERDLTKAREVVRSVRLMTEREVRALFPEATLYRERLFGMTKSIIAYHGW